MGTPGEPLLPKLLFNSVASPSPACCAGDHSPPTAFALSHAANGAIVMPDASLDKPPQPTRLADHRLPDFLIDQVELEFDLGDTETRVKSHLVVRRNPDAAAGTPLRLDGDELELAAISLDGRPLAPGDYQLEPDGALVIPQTPDAFALDITTRIHPACNTALSGLYMSGGNYCTQC